MTEAQIERLLATLERIAELLEEACAELIRLELLKQPGVVPVIFPSQPTETDAS